MASANPRVRRSGDPALRGCNAFGVRPVRRRRTRRSA